MPTPNVHKGKLRFRKGKGLAQGHRVISAKLGQSHGPSAPGPPAQQGGVPKGNSPLLPAPPTPCQGATSCGNVIEDFLLLRLPCILQTRQAEGGPVRTIPGTATACPPGPLCPLDAAPTWICSMHCCGDSADTHWISGLSLCRLKATAMSPHFWISGVDSTHQRR